MGYTSSKALLMVVEGLGINNGPNLEATAFSTHALSASMGAAISAEIGAATTNVYPVLSNYPIVSRTRIKILDPISSDSGFTFRLSATDAARYFLDYERGQFVEDGYSGGEAVLTSPATASDSTVTISNNFSVGINTVLVVENEAMWVTGKPSGTQLTVTRGVLGTRAVAHPVPFPPLVVWHKLPSIIGAMVRIYEIDDTDTVLPSAPTYRGRIDSIESNEKATFDLSISSLWAQVIAAPYDSRIRWSDLSDRPRNSHVTIIMIGGRFSAIVPIMNVQSGDYWPDMTHVALVDRDKGEKFVIVEASWGASGAAYDPVSGASPVYHRLDVEQTPIAWGDRDGVRGGSPPVDFHMMGADLHYAIVVSAEEDRRIGAVIEGFLTGVLPSGATLPAQVTAGYASGDIDLSGLDVPGSTDLETITGMFVAPISSGSVGDVLSEQYLRPWGMALSVGSDGKIRGINWGADLASDHTITTNDLASDAYTSKTDQASALLSVSLPGGRSMKSRRAAAYYGGAGIAVKVKDGALTSLVNSGAILARWRSSIFPALEIAPRITKLTVHERITAEVGDVATLEIPRLPSAVGAVGIDAPRLARVLEVSRDSATNTRAITMAVLASIGDGATWGPSAVAAVAHPSGSLSIEVEEHRFTATSAFVADDASSFVEGMPYSVYVMLCDQHLTPKSGNAVKAVSVPDSTHIVINDGFKSSGALIAIAQGDVIVWMDYDAQASSMIGIESTWLTDDSGRINGDEGRLYE